MKPLEPGQDFSRRKFVSVTAAAAAGYLLTACGPRRLYEMPPDRLREAIKIMEREYAERLGTAVTISDAGPLPGVEFAYALDISRCVGCRRCVYACVEENNQSRDPQLHWIRVLSMDKEGGVDFSEADPYYSPDEVPEEGQFYVPVQCQQCRNPPCTKVCPTGATWTEPDGIVVIDYDWCIGCRYCMAACPYGARHFNWKEPSLSIDELNTDMHYLGNRPRPKGVVEKCTFCIQRTREGRYPACVEVCPTGARIFGEVGARSSPLTRFTRFNAIQVLKPYLNTDPKVYYANLDGEVS